MRSVASAGGWPGPRFDRRAVTIAPGGSLAYDRTEWTDAIVSIVRGQVELETGRGHRRRFVRGDLLWLRDLPLRAIHNPGHEPAVVVAVRRRTTAAAG